MPNNMKILSEELKKYTNPTHLVDFTLGQDSSGNPIFASASETAETIDGWLTAGDNVVYRVRYSQNGYIYGSTISHLVDSIHFAAFISTNWFGPSGVYRLEARWGKTEGTWDALPTITSVIPMEKAGSHIVTCEEGEQLDEGVVELTNFSESIQDVYNWFAAGEVIMLQVGTETGRYLCKEGYIDEEEGDVHIVFSGVYYADPAMFDIKRIEWSFVSSDDSEFASITTYSDYKTSGVSIPAGIWNDGSRWFEFDVEFSEVQGWLKNDSVNFICFNIYDPIKNCWMHGHIEGLLIETDDETGEKVLRYLDFSAYNQVTHKTIYARWTTGQEGEGIASQIPATRIVDDYHQEAIAAPFSSLSTYAVGDVVMQDGVRWRCTTAISTADDFDSDDWTQEDVQTAINAIGTSIPTITLRVYDED